MPVKAPFRFARINRWIHEPAWGPLVSHDVPFADGLSGRMTLHITAKTPLLVGGRRRGATDKLEGAVWPFRLPDGTWALPPSTLQGMTRAILEVAAFGRLGPWVENRRFGIRDLANSATARKHYRESLRRTRAGWLITRDGKPVIVECEMARLSHQHLQHGTKLDLSRGTASIEKIYERACCWTNTPEGELRFAITRGRVQAHARPAANGVAGSVVVTGHVPRKKREFVFYEPHAGNAAASTKPVAEIPETVWETFEYLHCDSNGSPTHPTWAYWRPKFEKHTPVPVFWWADPGDPQKVATFGMAFAFKAGFPLSTHDLLRHSHPDHLADLAEAALDLPHLIFGVAAEGDKGRGLKRRAWFGLAKGTALQPHASDELQGFNQSAILSSPKPKYLGLYVRQRKSDQRKSDENVIPQGAQGNKGEPMAAYASLKLGKNEVVAQDKALALENLERPELAGVKLWPSSADRDRGVTIPDPPHVAGAQRPGPKVKTELHAVPAGTVFETPLTFHNLRPAELGALLWALSFGDPKAFGEQNDKKPRLRHRLGMGKPFGLGEVEIAIKDGVLDDGNAIELQSLVAAFTKHMEKAYPSNQAWAKSPQVQALLKAADPTQNKTGDLVYMNVTGQDSYVSNRNKGAFLGPYVDESAEIAKPRAENTKAKPTEQ